MDPAFLRVTGIAAVMAPLLMLASTVAHVANDEELNNGEVGGIVQVWAFIALGIAIVGLARLMEPATAKGALAVVVLGIGGIAAGIGYGIDAIAADVHGADSLQDIATSPAAPLALQIPGMFNTLSLVVLGVLLARHRLAPVVAAYAIVVGAILFLAARIPDIEAVALVGDAVLVVGFGGVGSRILRRGRELLPGAQMAR
jgi:hypothetical protein